MQDFVAFGSKKRTLDMMAKPEEDEDEVKAFGQEKSPVDHISKYFKRLKAAREEEEEE